MLPKKNRLNLKKQNNRNLFRKKIIESESIKYFADNSKNSNFKSAVVVSKKAYNKAFQRNKLRRKLYQIIQTHPVKKLPINLVLLVYKKSEHEQDLEEIMVKENLDKILNIFS